MRVVKMALVNGKFIETEIEAGLLPKLAEAKAKALNDARDTGNEDVDETEMVSYVATL